MISGELIEFFKKQFVQNSPLTHLNNAGLAPISAPARDEIKKWADRFYAEGFFTDADYMNRVKETRQSLAKLIECEWNDLAFFQSTASAISQIAFGVGLKEDDEVLLWEQEYASNLYPWKAACDRARAKLVQVPSEEDLSTPLEKLLASVTEKTKVIAISWVQFQTGAKTDLSALGEFCRKKGIFTCVDVMQGLGLHPFSMKKWQIDAVCGGSHKWLVAPVGVGFLALTPEWHSRIAPHVIGASTYGTCDDPSDLLCEPKKDALKFEAGSKQVLEITALGASVDLLLKVGIQKIENEAVRMAELLRQGLLKRNYTLHSPFKGLLVPSAIVNFTPPAGISVHQILESLRSHQVNFALRGPGVRWSPHAFNDEKNINAALSALDSIQ